MTDKLEQAIEALEAVRDFAFRRIGKERSDLPGYVRRRLNGVIADLRSIEPQQTVSREAIANLVRKSGDENWTDGKLTDAIYALQLPVHHPVSTGMDGLQVSPDGAVTVNGKRWGQWPDTAHRVTAYDAAKEYADPQNSILVPVCSYSAALQDRNSLIRAIHAHLLSCQPQPRTDAIPTVEQLAQKLVEEFGTEETGWDRVSAIVVEPIELAKVVQDILSSRCRGWKELVAYSRHTEKCFDAMSKSCTCTCGLTKLIEEIRNK